MSASREKKIRQKTANIGLTEKQKAELKQARDRKTRAIIYGILGGVAALAIAALLVWNSGVIQRNSTALTIHGEKYGPADVSYYYNQALNYEYQMMQLYPQIYGVDYGLQFDPSSDLHTQYVDQDETQTVHDYFLESAKAAIAQTAALYDAAMSEGFTLSEEGQKTVDDAFVSLDASAAQYNYTRAAWLRLNYGKYMTEKIYLQNLTRSTIANEYYEAKTEAMKDLSEDDLLAYYDAHPEYLDSYDFNYAYIDGTIATPEPEEPEEGEEAEEGEETAAPEPTEAEKAAALALAKANAEDFLAAVKAGDDFDTIVSDYVADADRVAYAVEGYTNAANVLGATLRNNGATYAEWLTSTERKAGDVEMFEVEGYGYYVIQYQDRHLDDAKTVDIRHILYKADPEDTGEEPTDEQFSAAYAKAQAAKEEYLAGEEQTAEAFGELANRDSDDPGSNENGGLYSDVPQGMMFSAFDAWIHDPVRQPGDIGLIKNPQEGQWGWHVIYFQGWNEPDWKETAKTDKSTDEINAWMEALQADYEAVDGAGLSYVG